MSTIEAVETVIKELQNHPLTQVTHAFKTLQNQYTITYKAFEAASDEARHLRIAVVGQMKAGKSSFLNAAFFNTDVLPKADTPMTAALTRMTYAAQPYAEVMFYTQEDWATIEADAIEYDKQFQTKKAAESEQHGSPFLTGYSQISSDHEIEASIPFEYKAAKELVLQVEKNQLNIEQYLGKTYTLPTAQSNAELAKNLTEYVGSTGQFTAITKMTSLYLNDPRLQGIELIDTPGFNDPVISRGKQTIDFLKQCDVIFLLSTTSQFLPQADLDLLCEQITYAGIDNQAVIVVGTQADIALRQARDILNAARQAAQKVPAEKRGMATLSYMVQLLDKKMKQEYIQKLATYLQNEQDDKTRKLLQLLEQNSPYFISAGAWLIAERFTQQLKDDSAMLQPLENLSGFTFDQASLRAFSKIEQVRNQLLEYKKQKETLLGQKNQALLEDYRRHFSKQLQEMLLELQNDLNNIKKNDLGSLQALKQDIEKRLNTGQKNLESLFADQIFNIERKFAALINESRKGISQARYLRDRQESHTTSYSVSTSKWYNPFSWGRRETRYETVYTTYANVQDSIEALDNFKNNAIDNLSDAIETCIDLDTFQENLAQGAFALFDISNADFDGEQILREVKKSIRKLTLPTIEFGRTNYSQKIVSQFSSRRVTGSSGVDHLRRVQASVADQILGDLTQEVENKTKTFVNTLEKQRQNFVSQLSKDIIAKIEDLEKKVKNKQQSIEEYEAGIDFVMTIQKNNPLV